MRDSTVSEPTACSTSRACTEPCFCSRCDLLVVLAGFHDFDVGDQCAVRAVAASGDRVPARPGSGRGLPGVRGGRGESRPALRETGGHAVLHRLVRLVWRPLAHASCLDGDCVAEHDSKCVGGARSPCAWSPNCYRGMVTLVISSESAAAMAVSRSAVARW